MKKNLWVVTKTESWLKSVLSNKCCKHDPWMTLEWSVVSSILQVVRSVTIRLIIALFGEVGSVNHQTPTLSKVSQQSLNNLTYVETCWWNACIKTPVMSSLWVIVQAYGSLNTCDQLPQLGAWGSFYYSAFRSPSILVSRSNSVPGNELLYTCSACRRLRLRRRQTTQHQTTIPVTMTMTTAPPMPTASPIISPTTDVPLWYFKHVQWYWAKPMKTCRRPTKPKDPLTFDSEQISITVLQIIVMLQTRCNL